MKALLLLAALMGVPNVTPNATDPATMLANWQAIQGTLDHDGPLGPVLITLPEGKVFVSHPVQVRTNSVTFRGQGRELTTLCSAPGASYPPLILNLAAPKPTGGPQAADIDSAGLHLRSGLHLAVPHQAWSVPSLSSVGYPDVPEITIELVVDFGPGPLVMVGPICGMADRGAPAPFLLILNDGGGPLIFSVATTDGRVHSLRIPRAGLSGKTTLALQASTITGLMGASINGTWRADVASPPSFTPGLKFADNPGVPMMFGGLAGHEGNQTDWFPVSHDFAFVLSGAKLSSKALYGPSAPNTDATSARRLDANTIALLPLDDDPAYVASSRALKTTNWTPGGRGTGCGFLLDADASSAWSSTAGATIRDMGFQTGPHGFALMTATTLHADIRDVAFLGGRVGLGNLAVQSNYVYSLGGRNRFYGNGHAIRLYYAIVRQTGTIQIEKYGREAIHLTESVASLDDVSILATIPRDARSVVYSRGSLTIRSFLLDNEDPGSNPAFDAIFRCDAPNATINSLLRIDDATTAVMPAGGAYVALDCPDKLAKNFASYAASRVVLGPLRVQVRAPYRAMLDVRDPHWYGVLDPLVVPSQPGVPTMLGILSASPVLPSAPVN